MADFDPATGAITLTWWGATGILAVMVALLVLAILRAGGRSALTVLAQFGALAFLVFTGTAILDRMDRRDDAEERRTFDARIAELSARTMAPGSALGCLDPVAADALDESCEKALFNNPESIAAAAAYENARLLLLAKAVDFQGRNPGSVDEIVAGLRRGLERDRYGIVAHIFAARDGCKPDACEGFELLNDSSRVVANMRSFAFETRIAKASATASVRQPEAPVAAASTPTSLASTANPSAANFPSANSIPPVSIMNNEPGATGQNGVDESKQPPKTEAKPSAAARAEKPADKPAPKRAQNTAPLPIAPARAQ
jgi:hypothetical protein